MTTEQKFCAICNITKSEFAIVKSLTFTRKNDYFYGIIISVVTPSHVYIQIVTMIG